MLSEKRCAAAQTAEGAGGGGGGESLKVSMRASVVIVNVSLLRDTLKDGTGSARLTMVNVARSSKTESNAYSARIRRGVSIVKRACPAVTVEPIEAGASPNEIALQRVRQTVDAKRKANIIILFN
jgi:hypothetical protein